VLSILLFQSNGFHLSSRASRARDEKRDDPKASLFQIRPGEHYGKQNDNERLSSDLEAQPGSEPDGMALLFEAGLADGTIVKRLFDAPGFSLIYNWFKPGFPLPRHSHDTDCLYYIVGGTLRLGTEDLGPGDGFFMPADTPYTYKVGDEGVQVIEFRHEGHFSMRTMGSPTYWEKAIATVTASREDWLEEVPPKPALLPVC
jgi:quercetin dioxygenase-like cupin family protein